VLADVLAMAIVPLSGCRGVTCCRGLSYDIADGAHGADSERAALDGFLGSGDSRDFPTDGWTGPSPTGVLTSGTAKVTVSRPRGSTYWFVIDAQTCCPPEVGGVSAPVSGADVRVVARSSRSRHRSVRLAVAGAAAGCDPT
jgi:hypothetical protein